MQKVWIVTSIIVVTVVFIYWISVLSSSNTCTWVRAFDCKKTSTWVIVPVDKNSKLKATSDLFLKYCTPKILEDANNYVADYSDCDLKVSINKENTWVQKVVVNNTSLSRDEINNIFK